MSPAFDQNALRGSVEGYLGRSKQLFDQNLLDISEAEFLAGLQKHGSGFSFPTNEGMRKITKTPDLDKIESDEVLSGFIDSLRTTIRGVKSPKSGGVYAGVNAFHHGHLAYLSKSEAVVGVDYNKLIPYGFGFIVGLVGGAETKEDFKNQVASLAADPKMLDDFFGKTGLSVENDAQKRAAVSRLLSGLLSVMKEFDPRIHGQNKIPPVFCEDGGAYNYFRTLIMQDKVAGVHANLKAESFIGVLAKALEGFKLDLPEINSLYVSSCYDPRFLKPAERNKMIKQLRQAGHSNVQMIESFLNSGWIVYDIDAKPRRSRTAEKPR